MDELGLYDRDLIIILLFHDIGEDTPMLGNAKKSYDEFVRTAKFRLNILFNSVVSDTVIRLTKPEIDTIRFHTKDEVYAYYIVEMKKSERAIIGKMIDRLHNLRSLPVDKIAWIKKQLDETGVVYMPIFTSVEGEFQEYAKILVSKIETQMQVLQSYV